MFTCISCNKEHSDGPVCCVCKNQFDFACAGVTETGFRRLGERRNNWRCPGCKSGSSLSPAATSPMPSQLDSIQEQLSRITFQLEPLKSLTADVAVIKAEMSDLKASVEMAHSAFASLDARVKSVEKALTEIPDLQEEVCRLRQELEDRDQWARANNVEIRGVPLRKGENLYEIAERIGELSNFPIRRESISYIARIPTRVPDAEKPIIISFNNRYIKEDLVASARKSKQLTLAGLGFSATGPFYVNDHLTQKNKTLLSKARSLARETDFRYVWVKHAKIMARKSDTSPVFIIRNEKDLLKIV
ncbi:uncharacterized protein LOC132903324 [Amyelois transitella]|uniref:uncharacterized protein LOC106133235 n=1 Tax=Amyelois transitella TaxID=680683 RepID=UPI00067AE3C5|nr:uncharacterized protein LOC106133235 [Amyelois transitella]XP_060801440.1 uncharacterized protein LOC132901996 [Amyelois transitella]XP_060801483.1 uncharacterized protein LOC132902002 [Amyelois transitella]XP_060802571.1 uncharacterized protein LOC132902253 [Amyelois transitella]XP_060804693.1 uncharacterized protein LOC132902700 [Amyelois transitella]XP_060805180.1 uncharacterized protein LOC132902798 [Amyelois transitella]XP_060807342.1 uncharacterized protein LOC132903324 [Amyelois tra